MVYKTMLAALTADSGLEARLHTAKALAGGFDAVLTAAIHPDRRRRCRDLRGARTHRGAT